MFDASLSMYSAQYQWKQVIISRKNLFKTSRFDEGIRVCRNLASPAVEWTHPNDMSRSINNALNTDKYTGRSYEV
jgi:hypothetical protein